MSGICNVRLGARSAVLGYPTTVASARKRAEPSYQDALRVPPVRRGPGQPRRPPAYPIGLPVPCEAEIWPRWAGTVVDASGGVTVTIERAGWLPQLELGALFVLAIVNALSPASRAEFPRRPYVLRVRGADGKSLYRVGVFRGQDAIDAAKAYVDEIKKVGVDDWVFKKTHSWRIDT